MITNPSPQALEKEIEHVGHELKAHERHDARMYGGGVPHHLSGGMHPAELKDCIEEVVEEAIEDLEEDVEEICEHIKSNTMKGHHKMYANPLAAPIAVDNNPMSGVMGIAALGLLFREMEHRGDRGGERGEIGTMEILRNENDNGRFADVNNRISAGNAALQSAIDHNSTLAAQARTDDMICGIEKDFFAANLAESERISNVRRDIADTKYDGALAELRTQAEIKNCCCENERLILDSRFIGEKTALENKSALERQIEGVACLIKENNLKDQLRLLEARNKELEGRFFVDSQQKQTDKIEGFIYRTMAEALGQAGYTVPV